MTRLPPPPPDRRGYPPLRAPDVVYQPVYAPGRPPIPPRRRQRSSPVVAPLLALLGVLIIGGASLYGLSVLGPSLGTALGGAAASGDPSAAPDAQPTRGAEDPAATPGAAAEQPDDTPPPAIVEPTQDERADVRGTILFSRAGDIWAASGKHLTPLLHATAGQLASSPTWSPDGKSVYFIRTTKRTTPKSRPGGLYTLYTTDLMRMSAQGSRVKRVYESLIRGAGGNWFSYVLQPDVSPTGRSVAVVSDGPDGSGAVELHLIDARSGRMRKVAAPAQGDLGHNDPAFSPDGRRLAFTYNHAQGDDGVPRIGVLTCRSRNDCTRGRTRMLASGFAHPSWSPDGTWIAAEATRGAGRDIVILDAKQGNTRVRLTNDGDSFAPVVSPAGDQIAYLHRDGIDIDVRVLDLAFDDDGSITLVGDRPVTQDGGIDGESPPDWFIPPDELPADGGAGDDGSAADGAGASATPALPAGGEPAPPG